MHCLFAFLFFLFSLLFFITAQSVLSRALCSRMHALSLSQARFQAPSCAFSKLAWPRPDVMLDSLNCSPCSGSILHSLSMPTQSQQSSISASSIPYMPVKLTCSDFQGDSSLGRKCQASLPLKVSNSSSALVSACNDTITSRNSYHSVSNTGSSQRC